MHDDIRMNDDVRAGQAVYTPLKLKLYDLYVLGINNRFFWHCPTRTLLDHYNRHVSANHLDVGVGSGYFLDHCRFPEASPRLVLMDLSPHSLEATARRVARHRPRTIRSNVLEPVAFDGEPFDSIGMSYLLHCVPGSIREKAVAFDHLGKLLKPGGKLFGATLLSGGVERTFAARKVMDLFNAKGVFHNDRDTLDDLERALGERFRDVSIRTVGSAALFAATMPATS
ncbi:class I SAM-dependent methyltransferase [Polyangium aurulentum]|uniref:class I SAM-dependent methyltransferase n=1 Tax=Polyangium aurulentum TaxID=2567896 RepID=UPI00197EEC12|nr:class I SAM-dependent methyltransferase [Polyangium aurulentum]UQA56169.1 class I SAM-dependent methyltransferase [Polyangium aurulentum]